MENDRDELIWMAGFFDGEGCVSVARNHVPNKNKTTTVYWAYNLSVIVTNRHEGSVRRFHNRFSGNVYQGAVKGSTFWRWVASGMKAEAVLNALLPYLLIKRPVAEVGLRFNSHIGRHGENKKKGRTPEVLAELEMLHLQAKALNLRLRANPRAPKYEGPRVLALKQAI